MKTTTIQKWGNSYAVRIPVEEIDRLQLTEGQAVQVRHTKDGKSISITPVKIGSLSLEELVSRITPENRHEELDWGPPIGEEIW